MTDKIALITGASRGLGHALAEALAPDHHIVAIAKTSGALEELDDRIQAKGGSATLAPIDVTNRDAVAGICRAIYDRWGKIDLFAHCAIHGAPLSPLPHSAEKDLKKSIETNVVATSILITMVAPLLGDAGTAIFFDDPRAGQPFFGQYGATKAAQIALAKSWQAESRKIGPRVLIHQPDEMPTGTRARFFPGQAAHDLSTPQAEAEKVRALL
ncbi:MAG: SDR family oxidoreductase [Dinoroseobacter sp.]|nr:SDR family oxidoreductase [Dinoroseobacter sp.]